MPDTGYMLLNSWQTLLVKGQRVNALAFATAQLSPQQDSSHRQRTREQAWLCQESSIYTNRQEAGFGSWAVVY